MTKPVRSMPPLLYIPNLFANGEHPILYLPSATMTHQLVKIQDIPKQIKYNVLPNIKKIDWQKQQNI